MTTQFNETAPGVHTATLTNPKSKQLHNVAIIESCDAFQVFIDGELQERDLPSFRAAAAVAERKVCASRSLTMAHAAGILVLLSVAGGSAIGVTKVFGLGSAPAPSIAMRAPDPTIPNPFGSVKSKKSETPQSVPAPIVKEAEINANERTAAIPSPYAAQSKAAVKTETIEIKETNPPVVVKEETKPSTTIATSIKTMAPIMAAPTAPKAVPTVATSNVKTASLKPETPVSSPVEVEEPATTDQFSAKPPLPVMLKMKEKPAQPRIQTATAPLQPPVVYNAVKTAKETTPTPVEIEQPKRYKPRKVEKTRKRRFRSARSNSKRSTRNRRSYRSTARYRKQRTVRRARYSSRRTRTAVSIHVPRVALRMVCIAHSCRFR
jgi:hypothetical protein